MSDIKYYTENYETPALSMIADSGFPVCYGEKGILEGVLVSEKPFSNDIVAIQGGSASNMIPDNSWIVLKGETAKRAAAIVDDASSSNYRIIM